MCQHDFFDKSRYDIIFQQVAHKVGESAMNYTKIFQNAQDLSVSVGNNYLEYQRMHTFLDNFHQGGKYSSQIASQQAELRIEETFTYQKCLSISSLQTDYLNLYSSSCYVKNSEIANLVQKNSNFCGCANYLEDLFKKIRK